MYFEDLSDYAFSPRAPGFIVGAISCGWLSGEHDFSRGECGDEFYRALTFLCSHTVRRFRGYHSCDICSPAPLGPCISKGAGERELILGGAEIRVLAVDGRLYAAPDLILHYVEKHFYRPPDEFVQGVIWSYRHQEKWRALMHMCYPSEVEALG